MTHVLMPGLKWEGLDWVEVSMTKRLFAIHGAGVESTGLEAREVEFLLVDRYLQLSNQNSKAFTVKSTCWKEKTFDAINM